MNAQKEKLSIFALRRAVERLAAKGYSLEMIKTELGDTHNCLFIEQSYQTIGLVKSIRKINHALHGIAKGEPVHF